jgi:hypothetical protein
MNQKKALRRKKKNKKKIAKDIKNINRRKEFIVYLLKLTNNYDLFAGLPRYVKEAVFSVTWPQIIIDTSLVKKENQIQEIEENIKFLLDVIKIDVNKTEIPVSSVHGIIGIYAIFKGIISDGKHYLSSISDERITRNQERIKKECESALEVCKTIFDNLETVLQIIETSYVNSIGLIAGQEVLKHFSLKEKCLYPTIEIRTNERSKKYPAIVLNNFTPKQESITIDGISRNCYLCKAYTYKGLIDCTLPAGTINNDNPLPVYIQEHAINRLFERIGLEPHGYIYDCIGRSLLMPKVISKDGSFFLIEFDYYMKKLGYLLITNEGRFAAIRSFKFLTMSGTPEFYKLKKLLKGSREDFEYLGLDSLSTFLNSDILHDVTLKGIFDKCDLGHLFDVKSFYYKNDEQNVAEEIKQYFKLS